ncbi:MAG: hypothetical protein J6V14_06455, partial [Clostridia bacterium]|nr:hypothetical protein [Clostridia bacterium]
LNWVDNTATFTLFDTDYVLDLDAQILRKQNIPEQSIEKRNLLDPGAGRYFVGIINDILYVDSITLTFALYDLKLYSWIENNSKNNSVSLVNNPNYQHGS